MLFSHCVFWQYHLIHWLALRLPRYTPQKPGDDPEHILPLSPAPNPVWLITNFFTATILVLSLSPGLLQNTLNNPSFSTKCPLHSISSQSEREAFPKCNCIFFLVHPLNPLKPFKNSYCRYNKDNLFLQSHLFFPSPFFIFILNLLLSFTLSHISLPTCCSYYLKSIHLGSSSLSPWISVQHSSVNLSLFSQSQILFIFSHNQVPLLLHRCSFTT